MKPVHGERKQSANDSSCRASEAKEEAVRKYLPLVRFVAEKVHRRLPPGVDVESLINSGVVGLLEALDRFDARRGVDFEVYARYRIQGEVMQYLRSLDWVSRSVRSWGRKIKTARNRLAGALVREPTAEEMSQELQVPLEIYFRLDQQVSAANLLSLEDLSVSAEADWEKTQTNITQNDFVDPLTFVEGRDLIQKLAAALETLPERERLVVTLYYHEELTLREIGEILDLSEGRICQIFAQAVGRLRGALGVKPRDKEPAKRAQEARKPSAKKTVGV